MVVRRLIAPPTIVIVVSLPLFKLNGDDDHPHYRDDGETTLIATRTIIVVVSLFV